MSATKEQKTKLKFWELRAIELMNQFNLVEWKFKWMNRKTNYGRCCYGPKTIELSIPYVLFGSDDKDIENTIRHEIGHALAPRGSGHGPKWKALARTVGFNPVRCSSVKLDVDQFKYVSVCPNGHVHKMHRRPKRKRSCGTCSPVYDVKFGLKFMPIEEAKAQGIIKDKVAET